MTSDHLGARPADARPPMSPSEHHLAATMALHSAKEYGLNSAPRIALLMEAQAHATLALYRPVKAPTKRAAAKEASASTETSSEA